MLLKINKHFYMLAHYFFAPRLPASRVHAVLGGAYSFNLIDWDMMPPSAEIRILIKTNCNVVQKPHRECIAAVFHAIFRFDTNITMFNKTLEIFGRRWLKVMNATGYWHKYSFVCKVAA